MQSSVLVAAEFGFGMAVIRARRVSTAAAAATRDALTTTKRKHVTSNGTYVTERIGKAFSERATT